MIDVLIRNWDPKIGDPSVMGWVTVAAYFVAAFLLGLQWRRAPMVYSEHLKQHRCLLLFFAVSMFVLGINKQLDIQTWLTNVGRDVSKAQGWWENRRIAQFIVLIVVGSAGLLLCAVILRSRGFFMQHRLALFGFLVLVIFVLMRASSFFQMDQLINKRILGIRMNWVCELTGIGIIAFSAVKVLAKKPVLTRSESD